MLYWKEYHYYLLKMSISSIKLLVAALLLNPHTVVEAELYSHIVPSSLEEVLRLAHL